MDDLILRPGSDDLVIVVARVEGDVMVRGQPGAIDPNSAAVIVDRDGVETQARWIEVADGIDEIGAAARIDGDFFDVVEFGDNDAISRDDDFGVDVEAGDAGEGGAAQCACRRSVAVIGVGVDVEGLGVVVAVGDKRIFFSKIVCFGPCRRPGQRTIRVVVGLG